MTGIFISYSREDEIFARLLASDLERTGATIWMDVEDIPYGADWENEIEKGLDECRLLILIISPASMQSINVEREWTYFLSKQKPIIPILWQGTNNIPSAILRLNHIDYLRQKYASAHLELIKTLQGLEILPQYPSYKLPIVNESKDVPEIGQIVKETTRQIHIVAITSYIAIGGVFFPTLNKRLKSGCDISIIMLNPNAESAIADFTRLMNNYPRVKKDIEAMLDHYDALIHAKGNGFGKCEVRLVDFYMPYSMVGVDMYQVNGLIRLSYIGYSKSGTNCPRVIYTRTQKTSWYDFYIKQFQRMWEVAQPYNSV